MLFNDKCCWVLIFEAIPTKQVCVSKSLLFLWIGFVFTIKHFGYNTESIPNETRTKECRTCSMWDSNWRPPALYALTLGALVNWVSCVRLHWLCWLLWVVYYLAYQSYMLVTWLLKNWVKKIKENFKNSVIFNYLFLNFFYELPGLSKGNNCRNGRIKVCLLGTYSKGERFAFQYSPDSYERYSKSPGIIFLVHSVLL